MSSGQFLKDIQGKIANQERLSREDGLALMCHPDLLSIGKLARQVKIQKTGKQVFFNLNFHINLTNVCASRCKFCAFGRDQADEGSYTMTLEEVLKEAEYGVATGATELHIVSALHPALPFDYYVEIIQGCRDKFPSVHLKAFTAVEIDYFSRISGLSLSQVLTRLKEAGLGSLPGGGAEVFSSRVRSQLCPNKATGERWLEVMRTAHGLGLKSNSTMLYGQIETVEERIDHLLTLRQLQDETGGFQSFIPLPFHPENTQIPHLKRTTAYEDLKVMAVSRLLLDNFDHIKAYWIMLGIPVAQLSLAFGADDLDGTVVQEKITHAAGARTAEGITQKELLPLIREAGYIPVERDTLYNTLKVYA
ncbi:MAG: aminofutalosine synthase MqnE [Syntrophomonadaceae bacterium]|nr:aminofutalosine synthase MqnE [Syntrophomonadaceae bacterium]